MGALDRLKAFAGTRRGQLTLGGSAVGGVVGLALLTRHRAGGDPSSSSSTSSSAPPFGIAPTGASSGTANGAFDTVGSDTGSTIDAGALEDLISNTGRIADAVDELLNNQPIAPAPTPAPPPTQTSVAPTPAPVQAAPAPTARTYTVVPGDNLTRIAGRFGFGTNWHPIYDANVGVIGSNPNLIKPGQVLTIPG